MFKNKLNLIPVLTTLFIAFLLIVPNNIYSFGNQDKEKNYKSGEVGVYMSDTGAYNIAACKDYEFQLLIWNDPLGTLTEVTSEVTLPKTFSNTGSFQSKAVNTAKMNNNETVSEEDVDTLAWESSANGKELKFIPGRSVYYFGANQYPITPTISDNGSEQKVKFSGLPNLHDNESVQISFLMRVGGTCLNGDKKLTSDSTKIYQSGEKVSYEMNLINSGKYRYKDVSVIDTFDTNTFSNNLSDITVESLDGRTISNVVVNNNQVSFNISGEVLAQTSTKVKLTFTVKQGYTTSLACNISAIVKYRDAYELFNNQSNITANGSLCVNLKTNPGLEVVKKLSTAQQTGKLNFDIEVKNTGDVILSNILVTDFYDDKTLVLESTVPAFSFQQNGEFRVYIPNLNPGVTGYVKVTFNIKPSTATTTKLCNNNISVSAKTPTNSDVSSNWNGPLCVDYTSPSPKISVIKYLSTASISGLEYKVEVSNVGNTVIKNLSFKDEFDKSRLSLNSTTPQFSSNNDGIVVINELLQNGAVLNPDEKTIVTMKFNILEKAPTGLACNIWVESNGKDSENREVYSKYVVEKNTQNCVNLTIITEEDPYFSISKRLVSNTDAKLNEVITWEVIARNICNNEACKNAETLEFKDVIPSDKLYFNSMFAQLKNADGTNVNANPIQFNPTSVTVENNQTIIRYSDITDVVGNISKGQYIVITIYTTAKATSGSCVLNTATVVGPVNSVTASACVNIGEVLGTTDTPKDSMPKTDLADLLTTFNSFPIGIKIALSIALLSIITGIVVPATLLVKSKNYD